WHVEGLWRPNTLNAIASFEGIGKSYARLQAGLLLAAGRGALFGRYSISGPCIVAVADEENGDAEEWRREQDCLAYLGLTRADVARYHRVSFAGLVLGDPAWQAELEAEMVRLGEAGLPVVIFLDTVTSMHDGKEWGEELKPIVRYLRGLLHRLPFLTVVLVVHVRKPSGEEHGLDTELSSVMGNWTRQTDSVAIMAPLTDGRARWRVHKRVPPSDIVLAREAGGWRYVADHSGKVVAGIDPLALLDLARERGRIEARDVMARFGVTKKPALQAIREHPGLDCAATGPRGALIAWPKEEA
ncbi:MAG: AAA family ATPase, partial [Candidatus Limnocylindrales bacterium]